MVSHNLQEQSDLSGRAILNYILMVTILIKVVDLDDKTRELKYKSKMVSFLRQNWWPVL